MKTMTSTTCNPGTPTAEIEAVITLCDPMNPSIGYQIRLERRGERLLFTAVDPMTGTDLITFADALRVAGYYA